VRGVKRGQKFEKGATAAVYLLVDSSCEMISLRIPRNFRVEEER